MDGAVEGGGRNLAPRPMETVLAGTGGCTAYDVVLILKRGRQQVSGCVVKIDADRAETEPKVFTRIHMHFTVSGKGLSEAAVSRAIQLSHEKYCSASAMLAQDRADDHRLRHRRSLNRGTSNEARQHHLPCGRHRAGWLRLAARKA